MRLRACGGSGLGGGRDEFLDAIENARGNGRLRLQRHFLDAVVRHHRHGICRRIEADARLRHVIGDDQVDVLALELAACVRDDIMTTRCPRSSIR